MFLQKKTSQPLSNASYTVLSGNPKFLADGNLKMTVAGDSIVWEWPWFILGWNGLSSFLLDGNLRNNFQCYF